MRYGAKYGGTIYLSASRQRVVEALQAEHGEHMIERGAVLPNGWSMITGPADDRTIEILRAAYRTVDLDALPTRREIQDRLAEVNAERTWLILALQDATTPEHLEAEEEAESARLYALQQAHSDD